MIVYLPVGIYLRFPLWIQYHRLVLAEVCLVDQRVVRTDIFVVECRVVVVVVFARVSYPIILNRKVISDIPTKLDLPTV